MSKSSTRNLILDTYKQSGENEYNTRKQIKQRALSDLGLLVSLVMPHIDAIIASAVKRAIESERLMETGEGMERLKNVQNKEGSFGLEILKAVASGKAQEFGYREKRLAGKPEKVSQRHIDAINAISAGTISKKK